MLVYNNTNKLVCIYKSINRQTIKYIILGMRQECMIIFIACCNKIPLLIEKYIPYSLPKCSNTEPPKKFSSDSDNLFPYALQYLPPKKTP